MLESRERVYTCKQLRKRIVILHSFIFCMILSLVFFSTLRNCHPNLIQAKIELYNFVFVSHASVMFHATTCFEVVLDLIHKKVTTYTATLSCNACAIQCCKNKHVMDKLKYNITFNSRYDLDKVINTRGIILRTVLDIQCTLYYIKLHY